MAETKDPSGPLSPESAENPPQLAEQQQSELQKPREKYKELLYKFGIAEVVFGCLSVLLAIATLIIASSNPHYTTTYGSGSRVYEYVNYYRHFMTYSSQGIWCGALLIAAGVLGIKAKSNPSELMFIANMGLAFITAGFMVALMTMSGIAAGNTGYGEYRIKSLLAFHLILAILGLPAGILCLVHFAYCCVALCCHLKARQAAVAQPYGTAQPQQMVRLADGQYMMVPSQPMASQGYPQTSVPVVAGAVMHPPPQGGVIMQQMTMPPQAPNEQPAAIYPGGVHQPPQPGSTMMAPLPPTEQLAQTAPQSQPLDATKSQDQPPEYSN